MAEKNSDFRFVFSARWLRYIAFALVLVVVCLFLSNWQNHRRQDRNEQIANIERNYNGDAVPLARALPSSDARLDTAAEWTHVVATGTYDTAHTVLARNRSQDGSPGYYVVVPLRTQDDATILVVRGFLPTTETGSVPDVAKVPKPASGTVSVSMWLRPTQNGAKDDNPKGTIKAIDPQRVPDMANPYWHAYGQLDEEKPSGDGGLSPLPKPSTDPGSHLSYQLQWIAFGVMIIIGIVYAAVRERKNRQEAKRLAELRGAGGAAAASGSGSGAGPDGSDGPPTGDQDQLRVVDKAALRSGAKMSAEGGRYGDALAGSAEARARLTRRKKSRDEDAEDAWLDQQGY